MILLDIEQNKTAFISLIKQIQIDGADISGLLDWLENSDFFIAPASTQYHCNFEGGLCAHSLNVYYNLKTLCDTKCPNKYDNSSLIVVALLHDISKTNYYEKSIINKKIYNEHGSKHDNMGNFDWVAQETFKVKDAKDRNLFGTHEEASALMIGRFIPLTMEETLAIMHHHGAVGEFSNWYDMTPHFERYPLLALLHTADFLSTFIDEVEHE